MAVKTLIGGNSGTGKSTSLRNLKADEVAVVNPVGKPLPFRNDFKTLNGVVESGTIINWIKEMVSNGAKVIIVDDFQYLLSIPYMKRIKETGWDKYNDFASNYFDIITACDTLPEDVTVYFMTHTETLEDGTETVKLIGKLLREKICIEGLFTTVLKTAVNDGKYYFITQNNGHDTVKSPMGMFDSYAIDNDIAYVDAKIRNFYKLDGAVSDEEISEMDAEAKTDIEPPKSRSERKRHKASEIAEAVEEAKAEISEPLKQRKTREEVMEANSTAVANAGIDESTDAEEIPFEDVKEPELEPVPRRRRRRTE